MELKNYEIKLYLEGQDDDIQISALVSHAMELVFGLYINTFKCGDETISSKLELIDDRNETAILAFRFNNILDDEKSAMYQLATGNLIHKEVQSYGYIYDYIKNISFQEV